MKLPAKQQQDVQVRVQALLDALSTGSLSAPILERLAAMAEGARAASLSAFADRDSGCSLAALKKDDIAAANQAHVDLITGHYDATSYWVLGLKRLFALSMSR